MEQTNTCVVEGRVDIRLLARLDTYLVVKGIRCQTKSELVRTCLETLHEVLVANGKIKPYTELTFTEAFANLKSYGSLHKGEQNRRKLHSIMATESLAIEAEEIVLPVDVNELALILKAHEDERQFTPEEFAALSKEGKDLVMSTWPDLVPKCDV